VAELKVVAGQSLNFKSLIQDLQNYVTFGGVTSRLEIRLEFGL
jgi:hypothetical protein